MNLFLLLCIFLLRAAAAGCEEHHTKVALLAQTQTFEAGKPPFIWVGVQLKSDEGWHTYWKNPGDSGLPTRVRWDLPKGAGAAPLVWPVPKRFGQPPVVNYGYEGEVVLLSGITVPNTYKQKTFRIAAEVNWMECAEICVPGKTVVSLDVPLSKSQSWQSEPNTKEIFAGMRKRLPSKMSHLRIKATASAQTIQLKVSPPPRSKDKIFALSFFPNQPDMIEASGEQRFQGEPRAAILEIPRASVSTGPLTGLQGVLVVRSGSSEPGSEKAFEVQLAVGQK